MKTRAEFPIATVDYKRVSMSLSENGRQHPAHGSHDHPFPQQVRPQSALSVTKSAIAARAAVDCSWHDVDMMAI